MTNNPTIDGVSRELLERLVRFASGKARDELMLILDAPAAERQVPKSAGDAFRALTKEDYEQIGLAATASQQATLISALQSTIAQLQARIAELESGGGRACISVIKR